MMDFQINSVGLDELIPTNQNSLELEWMINLPHTEKSIENERMYSSLYYKYLNDEVDYLSERGNDEEELSGRVHWIGFKHQFFSSVLINSSGFEKPTSVQSITSDGSANFVRELSAKTTLPFNHKSYNSTLAQIITKHYQLTIWSWNV